MRDEHQPPSQHAIHASLRERGRHILEHFLATGNLGPGTSISPMVGERVESLSQFYAQEARTAENSVEHFRHEDGHLDIGVRSVESTGQTRVVRKKQIRLGSDLQESKVDEDVLRDDEKSIDYVRVIVAPHTVDARAVHIDKLHPERSFDQSWNLNSEDSSQPS